MRRITPILLILLAIISSMTACSSRDQNAKKVVSRPDIIQIRSICELATLECYYHNVAQSVKTPEEGITHIFEKDRKFWIEYSGVVKLGIDMSQVEMKIDGTEVEITIPEAKVMDIAIDRTSYNEDSFIKEQPGWNENVITAEDAESAIEEATETMKASTMENKALLLSAQNRAKTLIENYINQLGRAADTEYEITWNYLSSDGE